MPIRASSGREFRSRVAQVKQWWRRQQIIDRLITGKL
jgi:hypothetical protein